MPKIYVASSWRNQRHKAVVAAIRDARFDVYDFRNVSTAFGWHEIDPEWRNWQWGGFRQGLEHPLAEGCFESDLEAIEKCDGCVLLLPCGKSAHFEFGFAAGMGKAGFILLDGQCEPELMYKMADKICLSIEELIDELSCFFLLDLDADTLR